MFAFDLARRLGGMTVREMLSRMGAIEFAYWKARATIKFQAWDAEDRPQLTEIW